MPRYYFHLHLDGTRLPDAEGQDLQDPDEAWETARAAARDLMATDFRQPINWFACHFEVRDEGDDVVMEFPFSEAVEIKQPPN